MAEGVYNALGCFKKFKKGKDPGKTRVRQKFDKYVKRANLVFITADTNMHTIKWNWAKNRES